ncbi:MAG: hypothetical protein IJC31_03635 [Spirochaetaceae bacterium]|nr:hypothetical protein [Spirochaetaceae bacterium]
MKKILNTLIIFVVVSMGMVYGQPASPLSEGTDGLFSTDTDNVVNLTGYNNVVFDNFLITGTYGYVTAGATNTASLVLKTHVINAGGMFRGGDLTFGISYLGALGGNSDASLTFTETEFKANTTRTETSLVMPMLHNVKLLVGIPITNEISLGVRAGVDVGGKIEKVVGNGLTLVNLESFRNTNSLSFKPQLAAGTKLALSNGWTLSPTVDMFVSITNSSGAGQSVYPGENTGPAVSGNGSKYEKKSVMKTYIPGATLGVGINFPRYKESINLNANLSYGVSVTIQPEKRQSMSSYDSDTKTGKMGTHIMHSDSGHSHNVILKLGANASLSDKLNVAGRLQLDTMYSHIVVGGTNEITGDGFQPSQTIETDTFSLFPIISAGATYQITETLSWYGGMKFSPIAYTFLKESQYAESAAITEDDKDITSHTIRYPILASFGTGLQFQPVERLLVSAGLLFAPSNDTVELSTIGDVLSNANLRLGLIWKD